MLLPDLQPGDVVEMRKPHPCGSTLWRVVRLGADIRLECLGCGRRIMLPRRRLARQMKRHIPGEGRSGEGSPHP